MKAHIIGKPARCIVCVDDGDDHATIFAIDTDGRAITLRFTVDDLEELAGAANTAACKLWTTRNQ